MDHLSSNAGAAPSSLCRCGKPRGELPTHIARLFPHVPSDNRKTPRMSHVFLLSRPLGSRRSHRVLFEEDSMRCEDLDGSRRVGLDLRAPILPTVFTRTISKRLRCDTRGAAARNVQREQSKQAWILRGRRKTHVEEKARKEAGGDAGQGWETKRA